ncbi:MAG TPA: 4Fe-4S binding protein [Candidatus Anoxymicrobiaceae bacterium]|jgi:formate hydrogenlyase subunit 6/NADH:ubiquinone oxidoreductase subunit I
MSRFSWKDRLSVPTYDNDEYATTGRLSIDHERCNGCGVCAQVCPGKAISIRGEGKAKKAYLDEDFPQCMSCNDCAAICERDALKVAVAYDFGLYYKKLNRGGFAPPRKY